MKLRNRLQLAVFILILTIAGSAQSQKDLILPNKGAHTAQIQRTDSIKEFREDFVRASEAYKAGLEKLLAVYEGDVKKLTDHSAKWKELYAGGLISRQRYESEIGNIREAQVKVDEVDKEIAATEIAIAEAKRRPQADEVPQAEENPLGLSAPLWTTGNAGIDVLIHRNGTQHGVDPYLIYCVIHQESRFRSSALSVKGAQGLMQLMPGTAARYGVKNANDPRQNIMGGTRYLKDLLQLFNGRIDLALAGYNAGEGAVLKYRRTVPPYKETRDYVRLISQRYLRNPSPPTSRGQGDFRKTSRGQRVRRLTPSTGQSERTARSCDAPRCPA